MTTDRPTWASPVAALPRTPVTAAEDALLLLRSGRAAMAERVLEGLPAQIRDALGTAYSAGHDRAARAGARAMAEVDSLRAQADILEARAASSRTAASVAARELDDARAELRRVEGEIAARRKALAKLDRPPRPDPGPKPLRPHQRLAAALAEGRVTAERVAAVLDIRAEDVGPIAAGRVTLATSAWRRLLREIGP